MVINIMFRHFFSVIGERVVLTNDFKHSVIIFCVKLYSYIEPSLTDRKD